MILESSRAHLAAALFSTLGVATTTNGQAIAQIQSGDSIQITDLSLPSGWNLDHINSTDMLSLVPHLIVPDADEDGSIEDGDLAAAVFRAITPYDLSTPPSAGHPYGFAGAASLNEGEYAYEVFRLTMVLAQGDLDFDGDVDSADAAIVTTNMGASMSAVGAHAWPIVHLGDIDLDGTVTFNDLLEISSKVGDEPDQPYDPDDLTTWPGAAAIVARGVLVQLCYTCTTCDDCGDPNYNAGSRDGFVRISCDTSNCDGEKAFPPFWIAPEGSPGGNVGQDIYFTGACCDTTYFADGVMIQGQMYKVGGGKCVNIKMACDTSDPAKPKNVVEIQACDASTMSSLNPLAKTIWRAANRRGGGVTPVNPGAFGGGLPPSNVAPPPQPNNGSDGSLPSHYPNSPSFLPSWPSLPGLPLQGTNGDPCDTVYSSSPWPVYFKELYGPPWDQWPMTASPQYPTWPIPRVVH